MILVHEGVAGRAWANQILWDLMTLGEHMELNHKAMKLIKDARRVLDRPPKRHEDARHWTWARALEPTENLLDFSAEMVPDRPVVVTRSSGGALVPPHCWYDARGHEHKPQKWDPQDNRWVSGNDGRASRRHTSWAPNKNKMPPGPHQDSDTWMPREP